MVAAEEVEGHDHQQVTDHPHWEKKRKPTELVEGECKKENKFGDGMSKSGGQKKKKKKQQLELADRKNKNKAPEKPPSTTGYDHVRARRGEATNSHSLAERVRREKISERMSLLQSLVPDCYKINGKTRVLDEIINYVQSLQNQAEFLATKLAYAYSMLNDLNNNNPALENFCNLETPLPSGPESDSIQAKTAVNETMASNSTSLFHQRNDVSIFFSEYSDTKACSMSIGYPWFECEINPASLDDNLTRHFQDDGDQLEYMDYQTQKLANDCAFNNSCFF